MARPRDSRGRYTTWERARGARMADLGPAISSLTRALAAQTRGARVADASLYSGAVVFRRERDWTEMIEIMLEADIRGVKKYDRVRYLIAGRNADGEIKPLSRAYASAELALGEAIATLEGETVLSPKEGDDTGADTMWKAIVVNAYLRKDAMR